MADRIELEPQNDTHSYKIIHRNEHIQWLNLTINKHLVQCRYIYALVVCYTQNTRITFRHDFFGV